MTASTAFTEQLNQTVQLHRLSEPQFKEQLLWSMKQCKN